MKIRVISNIINNAYWDELSEEDKDNIRINGPKILLNDDIAIGHLKDYKNAKNIAKLIQTLFKILVFWYFIFGIIIPIGYTYFTSNPTYSSFIDLFSLGFSEYLYNLPWYWELLEHIVTLFFFIMIGDSPLLYSYKHLPYLDSFKEHVLLLNRKGAFKENVQQNTLPDTHIKKTANRIEQLNGDHIFVVHGHDEGVKHAVARFINQIDMYPIILHEQISHGKTIIEKIEHFSNVIYSIVLLTPDDIAIDNGSEVKRARQNVIFELGYLMSKLGRNRVCALVKGNVQLPSDISGVLYVPFDEAGAWKMKIAKEMKSLNIQVDMNVI